MSLSIQMADLVILLVAFLCFQMGDSILVGSAQRMRLSIKDWKRSVCLEMVSEAAYRIIFPVSKSL